MKVRFRLLTFEEITGMSRDSFGGSIEIEDIDAAVEFLDDQDRVFFSDACFPIVYFCRKLRFLPFRLLFGAVEWDAQAIGSMFRIEMKPIGQTVQVTITQEDLPAVTATFKKAEFLSHLKGFLVKVSAAIRNFNRHRF